MSTTTTRFTPLTSDGVQAVGFYVPGWCSPENVEVVDSHLQARKWLAEQVEYWSRYAASAEVTYWGYDPHVYDESGAVLGTDGYPDATASIPDLDAVGNVNDIAWERA